jgi:hypothetical protein
VTLINSRSLPTTNRVFALPLNVSLITKLLSSFLFLRLIPKAEGCQGHNVGSASADSKFGSSPKSAPNHTKGNNPARMLEKGL